MIQTLTFDKIVPEGKALGRTSDGLVVFCDGVLPGETAEVEITKQKKSYAQASLVKVLKPMAQRQGEPEEHYLSCSPWQSVAYDYQLELKATMIAEAMSQQAVEPGVFTIVPSPLATGYRNKLEFVFAGEPGQLELALHARGRGDEVVLAPDGCNLGSAAMNTAATGLRDSLNTAGIGTVSRLVVREASERVLVILVALPQPRVSWEDFAPELSNLVVVAPTEHGDGYGRELYRRGTGNQEQSLGGNDLTYPYGAFFQINPAAFEVVLADITKAIAPQRVITELYGGVGTIGLALAKTAKAVTSIEINAAAIETAQHNAKGAKSHNFDAVLALSERIDADLLEKAETIVVDPPRAGLHQRVIEMIRESPATQLIYLSCNPVTQARDLRLLEPDFEIKQFLAYDFYPGTPHVETLATLERHQS